MLAPGHLEGTAPEPGNVSTRLCSWQPVLADLVEHTDPGEVTIAHNYVSASIGRRGGDCCFLFFFFQFQCFFHPFPLCFRDLFQTSSLWAGEMRIQSDIERTKKCDKLQ